MTLATLLFSGIADAAPLKKASIVPPAPEVFAAKQLEVVSHGDATEKAEAWAPRCRRSP